LIAIIFGDIAAESISTLVMSFLKKSGGRSDAEAELANGLNNEEAVDAEKQMGGK